jgi:hypothetical protein
MKYKLKSNLLMLFSMGFLLLFFIEGAMAQQPINKIKTSFKNRKSYIGLSIGGVKFNGQNNNIFDDALSQSPLGYHCDFEFGHKLWKIIFITLNNNSQLVLQKKEYYWQGIEYDIINNSWQFSYMSLGIKYEKQIKNYILMGQLISGLCHSLPYRGISDFRDIDKPRSPVASFIYGAEIGLGKPLGNTFLAAVKLNYVHTNLMSEGRHQSIDGIVIKGGLFYYFNIKK